MRENLAARKYLRLQYVTGAELGMLHANGPQWIRYVTGSQPQWIWYVVLVGSEPERTRYVTVSEP